MSTSWIMPLVITFLITSVIGPRMLPALVRLKFGQQVRDDGPQAHLSKQGTPTMGGFIFMMGIVLAILIFYRREPSMIPIVMVMLGFGIVGFLDDFLKIKKKQSEGLKPWQKLAGQLIISIGFLMYIQMTHSVDTSIIIPFTYGYTVDLRLFYYPCMVIVILGTVNGVNLTDGLDGLSTSVTIAVSVFFLLAAMILNAPYTLISAIVIGALLAFLMINVHPAKVFMGDLGSLALGGFVASMAIVMRLPLFILIFGIIYLVESLSVILQVGYYKKTKKRLFKMAPLHHHYELKGLSETQIVAFFTTTTVIMSLIAILAL